MTSWRTYFEQNTICISKQIYRRYLLKMHLWVLKVTMLKFVLPTEIQRIEAPSAGCKYGRSARSLFPPCSGVPRSVIRGVIKSGVSAGNHSLITSFLTLPRLDCEHSLVFSHRPSRGGAIWPAKPQAARNEGARFWLLFISSSCDFEQTVKVSCCSSLFFSSAGICCRMKINTIFVK